MLVLIVLSDTGVGVHRNPKETYCRVRCLEQVRKEAELELGNMFKRGKSRA